MKRILSVLLVCLLVAAMIPAAAMAADEIVDGKFVQTKKITVEVYDRGNDGGTHPEDNVYTDYIKAGLLADHNIEVTFVPVPRWTEVEQINNLLAAGDAPDVCVTYSYPTVLTYAGMGGVYDMAPAIQQYKDLLPNLWGLLGEGNINWNKDPETGTIWAIEALLSNNKRINTFVREDWLAKLNLAAPTSLEEFEAVLRAFRDNAELLLGADKDKMIPFALSFDVGWRADHLTTSFVPEAFATDTRGKYVYGFDDRRLLFPGYKEGVRKLNEWYNEGLIWKDFALYPAGDPTEDNLIKSGYVGAFMHNWDYPYRSAENGIHYSLQQMVGPEAAFIAVEPFANDAGIYRKYLAGPIDRKLFFPITNDEPLASLLYLDWISDLENRQFIQIGAEGVTHTVEADGAIRTIAAQAPNIMNSPNNIDYTITINGLNLGDMDLTVRSIALGYAYVDARFIQTAYDITSNNAIYGENLNLGGVTAEEGMGTSLQEKRNAFLDQSILAPADQFDKVYDAGMADYLASGGQAIIDERAAKYDKVYGAK